MSRLIAFGCSNTFGEGLPDCWDTKKNRPFDIPSRYAWPSLVADKLGIECINLSIPGSSNKHICNKILETDFRNDDIVIILWTYYSRYCIFNDDGSTSRILANDMSNKNLSKSRRKYATYYFATYYSDTDAYNDAHVRINLAKYFLDSKGIKNYHYSCNNSDHNRDKDLNSFAQPKWSAVPLAQIAKNFTIDVALDNMHPGVRSQRKLADDIYGDLQL